MATFAVKIGNAEYEVDAPDEATAWKYANHEHATAKPYDLPAGVKSMMNIGQALTFGFGDELAGLVGGDKERYRATVNQFKEEYPKSAMLGTVGGSMLLPFGAAKTAAAASSPWLTAATVGGFQGLAQGAGDALTMRDALKEGPTAAVLGMAAAPLVLGGMKSGGSVLEALGTKIPFLGQSQTQSLARRRVAEGFERDSTDASAVESRMRQLGPEARVGDAAGENTRSNLDLNANLPGKTKDQLEAVIKNRIATRPDRLDDAVYAVHGGVGRAGNLETALTNQQGVVARPLYAKAHSMEVTPSPQLVNDLEAAKKLGAFGEAEKRSLANPEFGPFTLGASQQKLGQGKIGVRDLDHIKQGIDSLIERETDAVTGKVSSYGRDLVKLKGRIVSEVDAATIDPKTGISAYKAARDAYAGPAALKAAIGKGRKFWAEDAESLADTMQGMTASEQQAFRVGAAEALRQKVGTQSGQNQLLNLWKDRNVREKLQALMGNDVKYIHVENIIKNEETLRRLEGLGPSRNSRTFSRLVADDEQAGAVAKDMVDLGMAAKTGGLTGILPAAGRLVGRVKTPEPVRDEIGRILLQQYQPAEMRALEEAQKIIRRQRAAAAGGAGVISGRAADGLLNPKSK